MPDVGEHYRPVTDDYRPGIYRVVGSASEVTLLRVTDEDGRRVHTGDVRHVSGHRFQSDFESATDPDAGFHPLAAVRNLLSGLYWDVRRLF